MYVADGVHGGLDPELEDVDDESGRVGGKVVVLTGREHSIDLGAPQPLHEGSDVLPPGGEQTHGEEVVQGLDVLLQAAQEDMGILDSREVGCIAVEECRPNIAGCRRSGNVYDF